MDPMLIVALISFLLLVVSWLALPNGVPMERLPDAGAQAVAQRTGAEA